MNAVYYTDGAPRNIKIYNGRGITFLRVVPKRLAFKNKMPAMLTFALQEIGKGNLSDEQRKRIRFLLAQIPQSLFAEDYPLMPEWIRSLIKRIYAELP
mgnify:CR=1 FL=1